MSLGELHNSVRETGCGLASGQAAVDRLQQRSNSLSALRSMARQAWAQPDPDLKCQAVMQLAGAATALAAGTGKTAESPQTLDLSIATDRSLEPGRPGKPQLVHPSRVPKRRLGSKAGRGAMLHAIAHIEFNAINLALDAIWRFHAMPLEFVADWVSVALDEARHFQMLTIEMVRDSYLYGDFDAHDGLWEMARKTADDCQARMAMVPRVLEARGLDATPAIQAKLRNVGDQIAVDILQTIVDEEVRHVRIGDYWFRRICRQLNDDPEQKFRVLAKRFDAPLPGGRINREARLAAGFSEPELQWLSADRNTDQQPDGQGRQT